MKPVDTEANFRITYSMTLAEANLIVRMCSGYVALERVLCEVKTVFPEKPEVVREMLSSLTKGVGAEIERAKQAQAVHAGRLVAVDPAYLQHLQDRAKHLAELERAAQKAGGSVVVSNLYPLGGAQTASESPETPAQKSS